MVSQPHCREPIQIQALGNTGAVLQNLVCIIPPGPQKTLGKAVTQTYFISTPHFPGGKTEAKKTKGLLNFT